MPEAEQPTKATPNRVRWRQFSLRVLLLLVLCAGIVLAWWRSVERSNQIQHEIARDIVRRGGYCASRPSRMARMTGREQLRDVWHVSFANYELPLTDDDAKVLAHFPKLSRLSLQNTSIGNEGLRQVARCKNLAVLSLEDLSITDAGLEHLMHLEHLRWINLYGTNVSSRGLRRFSQALPLCEVVRPDASYVGPPEWRPRG